LKTTNHSSNLTLIVAVSENDVIGKDNDLIWHLKNDLKRFKALTSGHCIIMGRKTFESFPKPLPNRTHIVITRQKNYTAQEGIVVVNSLEAAIKKAEQDTNPFIIGGGEIYKQALNVVDIIEFTRVHHSFEGDTFFPVISEIIWKETDRIFHKKDDLHKFDFSYITYKRR
jgi:dihydrofolate reductase